MMERAEELRLEVAAVLAGEMGAALEAEGVTVTVVGVEAGVVRVRLGGRGMGSPSGTWMVLRGLEEELRGRMAGVEHLEVVG